MTATDQLRAALRDLEAKARELELDKKIESLAEQADHLLREAAVKAGDYAHDNRERVEGALDRAGSTVDEKTDGKYSRYVEKLRTGVLVGVDWVAEQRESTRHPLVGARHPLRPRRGCRWPTPAGHPTGRSERAARPARPSRAPGSTSPTCRRRPTLRPTRSDPWFEVTC